MKKTRPSYRSPWITSIIVLILLLSMGSVFAQSQDTTEQPVQNPAPESTDEVTSGAIETEAATETVTATATESPTETTEPPPASSDDQPTAEPSPTQAASDPQETNQAPASQDDGPPPTKTAPNDDTNPPYIPPMAPQTFCQMDISDADDDNPFTYEFSVTQANSIESFLWTLGDGTTSSEMNLSHTYADVGTYNITLVCTPVAGFGGDITLNGSITIEPVPQAAFEVVPGYTIVQAVSAANPVSISTVNQSTPGGLTYAWEVRNIADNSLVCSGTDSTITCSLTEYGEYSITLTAHAGSVNSVMTRTVAINAPAPQATFTLSEASGPGPLLPIEITGIDQDRKSVG